MIYIAAKTRFVFTPFLFLSLCFITGYCFLYWLLHIRLDCIPLKEDVLHFWMPMALSLAVILLFIRPRIHLLKLDKDNGRIRGLYYLVGAAVACVPTIILLNLLDTATGKLTQLNNITEIAQKPVTKYYKPSSYVLHKSFIGIQSISSFSGKHNQYLDYNIYVALPFAGELYDTARSPSAFLYFNYHKQISSKTDEAEREAEWNRFWKESFEHFDQERIKFQYLERMPNSNKRDYAIRAARKSGLYIAGSQVTILKPVNEPFDKRNGNKLLYALISLSAGLLLWFIMIAIPGLHLNKVKIRSATQKGYLVRELKQTYETFKPAPGNVATQILIASNVLVFLVLTFKAGSLSNFSNRDLVSAGALYEPLVRQGQWWRLVTSMFVHIGIVHLIMNMIGLLLTGLLIENLMSFKRLLACYLISGIIGAVTCLWWHDEWIVAAGASGAIFGLYGLLLALTISKQFDRATKKFFLIFLGCTAGYSLLIGFLSEGVANSAHLGGLITGFLFGFFVTKKSLQREAAR